MSSASRLRLEFWYLPSLSLSLSRTLLLPTDGRSHTELAKYAPIAKSSSDQQPFIHHSDAARANTTDLSECSTNTEDYVTCTDASKRGTKPPSASSSSTTQVPGSNSQRCVRCEFDVIVLLFHIHSSYSSLTRIFKIPFVSLWWPAASSFISAFASFHSCGVYLSHSSFSLQSMCVLQTPLSTILTASPLLLISHVVATQSSQTLTQDGSSFESASSMYSLARVDAICDDGPSMAAPIADTLPLSLPPPLPAKPSPSHSVSSSSSGSYCLPGAGKKPAKSISTSPRGSIAKVPMAAIAAAKTTTESISDDEKSEKRYSSSGYYESPHDDGKYWQRFQFRLVN